ncbi:uncharacterized protein BYT42DRAFT_542509 [Radiomyces spectabilis]|uniref:uncharacterized protein n=1 Tax=Radiomyces spectabilis TaxID=64574 RepID=UPI002220D1AF|nr:uncharacterized protein BYT42DRAFT_542509 [Radiomyces spectabilis]KAI8390857.1 hypothetical protein BYT42DRAFT_542509 [Radiomyces spectabilis]
MTSFKILRRRIAWVLSKWLTEDTDADGRMVVYPLVGESDTVMKLGSDLTITIVRDRAGRETILYASKIIQLLMPLWECGQNFEEQAVQLFHYFITMIPSAVDRTKLSSLFTSAIRLTDYDTENPRKIF